VNKKVLFIGDKPGNKNLDPNLAFVGTKSYETLCSWIGKLHIPINNVTIVNSIDILDIKNLPSPSYSIVQVDFLREVECFDKVIVLGNIALNYLNKNFNNISTDSNKFKNIDHPSGLNRNLNNPEYVKNMLAETRKWLKS